jgi:hypothetical protein
LTYLLNMFKIRRLPKRGNIPIKMSQPLVDVGIIMTNHFQIRLEVLNIYRIESDDCWEETDIGFCEGVAENVGTGGFLEDGFDFIER